jgi:hypothetical protein
MRECELMDVACIRQQSGWLVTWLPVFHDDESKTDEIRSYVRGLSDVDYGLYAHDHFCLSFNSLASVACVVFWCDRRSYFILTT